jgi:hypothetical protein
MHNSYECGDPRSQMGVPVHFTTSMNSRGIYAVNLPADLDPAVGSSLLALSPLGDTAGQSALHASEAVAFMYLMRTGIAASRQKAELHGESATSRTRKSREGATSLEDVPLIIVIIIPKKE